MICLFYLVIYVANYLFLPIWNHGYFILLVIMQYYNYFIPALAIRRDFRLVSMSFWYVSSFSEFFVFWHQRYSRDILHFSHPTYGIDQFFKEPWFLFLKNCRVQDLISTYACCYRMSLLWGLPKGQSENIYLCILTHAYKHTFTII